MRGEGRASAASKGEGRSSFHALGKRNAYAAIAGVPTMAVGSRSTKPALPTESVGGRRYAAAMTVYYCDFAPDHPVHGPYHDHEYGFPQREESELFERLILEINQAGLSWETILKKREGFRRAYHGFDVDRVAAYRDKDKARLLADAGIIRNRLKIEAAIHNAQVIRGLRDSHGGFAAWLDAHAVLDDALRDKAAWVKLFKKSFRFTGGEIVGEFLMSLGYLPGAHREDCPAFKRIAKSKPMWMRSRR
jgi:DNA-3-methyladenine glycosylase I